MAKNPFSLEGKVILVTGASSGIGRACAVACAEAGASVVLTGRDEARLEETFRMLSQPLGALTAKCVADLSDEKDFENLLGASSAPYDGIVHCAGISKLRPFPFASPQVLKKLLSVNTLAPIELTRRLLKNGAVRNGASIVFVSSIAGMRIASVGQTAYALSKAALCGAAKAMALELAYQKTRVNCICPGAVETPIHASAGLSEEQLADDAQKNYPLQRYGKPEEIAYAAVYLLSDSAAWTTGTELVIDGGLTLR